MLSNKLDTLKNAREWKCKLTTSKGVVYTEADISSFKLSTKQDTTKLIGQTVARELEIEAMTTSANDFSGILKLEIGLKCWNAKEEKWYYEWRTLGSTFKADEIEQVNKFTTKVTCYDAMTYKFNDKYEEGTASTTTTTVELQQHIASKFGITFNKTVPNFEITNPYQETYRSLIGYLAILLGANCFYANDSDTIKFVPLVRNTVDLEVGAEFYFEYKEDRAEVVIKKVNLDLGGGFGYYAGDSGAEENEQVILELPFANQEIANHVFSLIQGYEPCGYELKFLGNPCLEPYDKIKLTTIDKVIHILDVASSEFNFNGGFSQTLKSEKVTEESSGGSYVENKLTAKINVLADKIQMQVNDLTDELNQAQSSITQTKEEILSQVETQFVKKTDNRIYSVILSNEFQNIPTNSEGYPLEDGSFECSVRVFNGSNELTDFQMSISATNSYGITVSVDSINKKVIFTYKKTTKITKNGDEITVYIRIDDETTLEKKISWTKTSNGVDGTSFNIKGTLESEADLPSVASVGDAYIIGGFLYVFTEEGVWSNVGKIQGEDGASISCNIVPNSLVFKSGDGGVTYNPQTIVLTAICNNCNLLRWEYYHNEWKSVTTFAPNLLNGNEININYDNSLLDRLNNQITFKAVTDVEGVIDIVTITKLSVLDNEVETIREISKSEVSQKANEILSTVETTYQKKSEMGDYVTEQTMNSVIDQKADEIMLNVKTEVNEQIFDKIDVGVQNLVLNSMPKETSSSSTSFAKREILELEDYTAYTLSFNGYVTSTSNAYLKVKVYREDNDHFWEAKTFSLTSSTEKLTFTTSNRSKGYKYYVESYLLPTNATGTATINWYKLERGVIATDYCPAIQDTENQFLALEDMSNDLQNQIDGKIETYYQTTDPSKSWTTTDLKTQHTGDIWHDSSNNITYRWSGTAWVKLTDSDAEEAKTLASSKAKVFTSQPTPPYNVGDLWVQGANGDIMRCVKARNMAGSYVASDWVKASKYTDDTLANSVKNDLANNYYTKTQTDSAINVSRDEIQLSVSQTVESVNENITVLRNDLQGQIDGKIETYYQSTDPSSSWTTTALKTQHKGDIWYNSSENVTYRWSGSSWGKLSDIDALQAQALANKKAQIFTSQPSIPYYKNDLWVQGASGDIMKCTITRTSGGYVASDWAKASKYTDDTTANNIKNNLETNYYTKTQTDSAINVAKESIELSVSKTVEDSISSIQIGGRNLAQKTSSEYCDAINKFTGATNECKTVGNVLTDGLAVGDTVCVRLFYKYNNITSASGQTAKVRVQGYGDVTNWNSGTFGSSSTKAITGGSGEIEFKYSFTVTAEHLRNTKWTVQLRHDYVASGSVQWKKFKVERGEMYTDWTPAPEDVEGEIGNVANNLSSNYYSKTDTESKIKLASDNITSSVSQTYATKDSVGKLQERVESAEQEITPTSIINKVNTSIGNGGSISTTSTTLNKNGFTVYNGAIYIKNTKGENVLWGDTNGNLQARGKITTINNNGYLNLEGNKLQGYIPSMSVPMYSCGMWYPNNGNRLSGFVSVSNGNSLLGDNEGCLYMSGWTDSSDLNKKAVLQYSRNEGGYTGVVEFSKTGSVSIASRSKDEDGGAGINYGIWNSPDGYIYPYRGDEYLGSSGRPWDSAYIKNMFYTSTGYFTQPSSTSLLAEVSDDEIEPYTIDLDNKPKPKDFVEFVENLKFGIYKDSEENSEEIQTFAEKETNLNFMPIVNDASTFALDENPAESLIIQTVTDKKGENPQQAINLMSYCSALAISVQELIKENKLLKERLDKLEKGDKR